MHSILLSWGQQKHSFVVIVMIEEHNNQNTMWHFDELSNKHEIIYGLVKIQSTSFTAAYIELPRMFFLFIN